MNICNKNTNSKKSPDFLFLCSELLRFPKSCERLRVCWGRKQGRESGVAFASWEKCGRSSIPPASLQAFPFFLFSLLFVRKWNLNCCTSWGGKLLGKSSRKSNWWILCCHIIEYINVQCLVFEQCIEQYIRLLSAIVLLPQDGSESVPYGGQGSLFSFIDYYFITLLTGTNGDFSSLVCGQGMREKQTLHCTVTQDLFLGIWLHTQATVQ